MRPVRLTAFDLAAAGDLEPLRGAAVGLVLRHQVSLAAAVVVLGSAAAGSGSGASGGGGGVAAAFAGAGLAAAFVGLAPLLRRGVRFWGGGEAGIVLPAC